MLVREVLFHAVETVPGALWLSEGKQIYSHDDLCNAAIAGGWFDAEAAGFAPAVGEPVAFWQFGDAGAFRLCVPQVLKIDGAPKGSQSTAKAIARADERLRPILYRGEYMLYAWRDGEDPILISVEYWMQTRAVVFKAVAESRRDATALEEPDDYEALGIDQTITADELKPEPVVYMVETPFPSAYIRHYRLQ